MKLCPSRGNLLTGHEKRLWYTLSQVLFLLGMLQRELVPISCHRVSVEASRREPQVLSVVVAHRRSINVGEAPPGT